MLSFLFFQAVQNHPWCVFLMMSVSAWISNSFSARSLFSREFSSSSALRRFASEADMPLYFCLHRYIVLGLIPYFLATDETELPGCLVSFQCFSFSPLLIKFCVIGVSFLGSTSECFVPVLEVSK